MMIKLLDAEFSRLFKSRMFRVCVVIMAGIAAAIAIRGYFEYRRNAAMYAGVSDFNAEPLMFLGNFLVAIPSAALTGIFIGTEYSDMTIRNKLISGHTRYGIYLSKLIVCCAATVILCVSYTLTSFVLTRIFFGKSEYHSELLPVFILCSLLFAAALAAVYLVVPMLLSNKSYAVTALLVISFIFTMTTAMIFSSGAGADGAMKKIYLILYDILPTCQLFRAMVFDGENMGRLSLCAALDIIVFSSAGMLLFNRKDMR